MGVSVYWPPECAVFLCVCVCVCVCVCMCLCVYVIPNQNTSKKPHYASDLSKLDTLLHKIHSKVLLVL